MPSKQLPVYLVPSTLNHISMARYNLIKIPPIDLPCTRVESLSITTTGHVPKKPLLPRCRTNGILERGEQLGQHPISCLLSCPTILFVRWKIEHHIRLDERPIRLVAKHQLFVRMTAYIFIFEFAIEVRIYLHALFVLHRPNMSKFCACGGGVRLAFLWEAFDAEYFGRWVGACPFGEEDVVFEVHGGDITNVVAECFYGGADFRSEGYRGKDGKGSILEAN